MKLVRRECLLEKYFLQHMLHLISFHSLEIIERGIYIAFQSSGYLLLLVSLCSVHLHLSTRLLVLTEPGKVVFVLFKNWTAVTWECPFLFCRTWSSRQKQNGSRTISLIVPIMLYSRLLSDIAIFAYKLTIVLNFPSLIMQILCSRGSSCSGIPAHAWDCVPWS